MNPPHRPFLVSCVILATASSSFAANTLQNAGFDVSGEGIPGWRTTVGTTQYSVVYDPVRRSNCIEGTEPEPGATLGRLIQNLGDQAVLGGRYRLTGWIKTTSVTSAGGVAIGVGTVNADGAQIPGSFQMEIGGVRGSSDWTFFDSGDFVLPDLTSGTVSHAVYLDFNGAGGGTARFDDVALVGPLPAPDEPVRATTDESGGSAETTTENSDSRTSVPVIAAYFTIFAAVFSALWAFRKYKHHERR